MMKVGDKFEQDGREYVAKDGSHSGCGACVFFREPINCNELPPCYDYSTHSDYLIFVEVKK